MKLLVNFSSRGLQFDIIPNLSQMGINMGDNMVRNFIHPFFNIQYNLTQNHIPHELLSDLENQARNKTIEFWKDHLVNKITQFEAENDAVEILCSDYNFDVLIEEGNINIIRNHANEEPEDIWNLLKLKIPKIGDEIFKFTEILTKLECSISKESLMKFLKGLYITQHGTIDYARTALNLIEKSKLQNQYKYKIACYFCLKEKILEFHSEFLKEYGHRFIFGEEDRLMVFWTYHLDDKDSVFSEKIKKHLKCSESTFNEHILKWAVCYGNEPAVHYIWKNLSNNELKENFRELIKNSLEYDNTNISCYLLSQVNSEDILEAICKSDGYIILSKLLYNPRWRNYYNRAADYVKRFVADMGFLGSMKTAIILWLGDESNDKERHRYLLNYLRDRYHIDIKFDFLSINFPSETFLTILQYIEDIPVMTQLLAIGNVNELKSLFSNDVIIKVRRDLMIKNRLYLLQTLAGKVFIGDELENFELKFYDSCGYRIF